MSKSEKIKACDVIDLVTRNSKYAGITLQIIRFLPVVAMLIRDGKVDILVSWKHQTLVMEIDFVDQTIWLGSEYENPSTFRKLTLGEEETWQILSDIADYYFLLNKQDLTYGWKTYLPSHWCESTFTFPP